MQLHSFVARDDSLSPRSFAHDRFGELSPSFLGTASTLSATIKFDMILEISKQVLISSQQNERRDSSGVTWCHGDDDDDWCTCYETLKLSTFSQTFTSCGDDEYDDYKRLTECAGSNIQNCADQNGCNCQMREEAVEKTCNGFTSMSSEDKKSYAADCDQKPGGCCVENANCWAKRELELTQRFNPVDGEANQCFKDAESVNLLLKLHRRIQKGFSASLANGTPDRMSLDKCPRR